jgi:hypothetical protein
LGKFLLSSLPREGRERKDSNFAPERIAEIVAKQALALKARPEMKRYLD